MAVTYRLYFENARGQQQEKDLMMTITWVYTSELFPSRKMTLIEILRPKVEFIRSIISNMGDKEWNIYEYRWLLILGDQQDHQNAPGHGYHLNNEAHLPNFSFLEAILQNDTTLYYWTIYWTAIAATKTAN